MPDLAMPRGASRVPLVGSAVCPAAGVAHAKGAWTELAAALPYECGGLLLHARGGAVDYALVDLGVGAAGSETVVLPDLATPYETTAFRYGSPLHVPLRIPAGSRVAVRAQAAATVGIAAGVYLNAVEPVFGRPRGGSLARTWGADAAASRGTAVTCATVGTGAWVEFSAATPHDVNALAVFATGPASGDTGYVIDLGVGAAGSETVVAEQLAGVGRSASGLTPLGGYGFLPLRVPAGSRLAVRLRLLSGPSVTAYVTLTGIA